MKRALFSDIHSNLEALSAVMADAAAEGCEDIVCLGDLIGYGPNPRQVLRLAMQEFRWTLLGNHEEAVLFEPVGFNWKAEASAHWTRDQILSRRFPTRENEGFWTFLESLPRYVEEGDSLYVHASPLDPTKEYILPESTVNRELMRSIFGRIRRVAFGGHTHMPGVFLPEGPFIPEHRISERVSVRKGKYFINTGSVGQPRDGDVRACYVIYDGNTVQFRRVAYNFRRTAQRIKRIRRLPAALGTRLTLGL